MIPTKLIRDGKIAVLYSPGHGAGWSTWANEDQREFLLFDAKLVEFAEQRVDREVVDAYLKQNNLESVYTGGWPCSIEWLTPGTRFYIDEYDGFESVVQKDSHIYIA